MFAFHTNAAYFGLFVCVPLRLPPTAGATGNGRYEWGGGERAGVKGRDDQMIGTTEGEGCSHSGKMGEADAR